MRPVLKEWIWSGGVYLAGLLFFWFSLPEPLFREPTSYLIESREGALLGARVAADGQWRFPAGPAIPEKFTQALITFEDKRFYSHPGIRSEEHTSELQSLMRISYAVFCLKNKKNPY